MAYEQADIVRYGQVLYVIGRDTRTREQHASQEFAEQHAIARYMFDGQAVLSNPSFARAFCFAKAACGRAVV